MMLAALLLVGIKLSPAALQMSEAARRQSLINLRKSGGIASKIGLWEKKVPEPGVTCFTSAAATAQSMLDCCCEHVLQGSNDTNT